MKKQNLIILLSLIFLLNINCTSKSKDAQTNIPKNNISVEKQITPDSFTFYIPLNYDKKEYSIKVVCEKDSIYTDISNITSNLSLPKAFYTILQENFGLATWLINNDYNSAFEIYKDFKFKRPDFVEYRKSKFREFSSKLLYVVDVDEDGYDDILLLNLQNSMRDNDVYAMFKGSKNGISYKENFFDKVAFYGWDKTGKYLITGVSDTRERIFSKNKIVSDKLVFIEKCTENVISDKFCW